MVRKRIFRFLAPLETCRVCQESRASSKTKRDASRDALLYCSAIRCAPPAVTGKPPPPAQGKIHRNQMAKMCSQALLQEVVHGRFPSTTRRSRFAIRSPKNTTGTPSSSTLFPACSFIPALVIKHVIL
uniref:(northern house mosquito) hypothetical protein n=1 Tax=Culex pipiens TaxID=7175 RepID=A0A8D8JAK8_CULPI